ncbi:alpha/beta hydrolase fold domain-containing protein [Kribbella sp.]|uniref:alpha/beta hydrolase fold domain-containing protein n=1 Tax=Kribbella sp. TaxID=1871183 RepID=UPI002D63613F|nr:alpha/beta hydrolase fold domain-containing protein [Kribbella sp.]HZX01289.1 alpha/beta hydrolase fold domain-containing protein [Kribbella sp.]
MLKTATTTHQPPLGVRLVYSFRKEPDYRTMSPTDLAAFGEVANRVVTSRLAHLLTGFPHSGVTISWQQVQLADRTIRVRVYRPDNQERLPLVLHVHGGGYVGTAVQCDWINSHVAARVSAVVVSVEHRLMDHDTPLAPIVDDGWDVLRHVFQHAADWGIDPTRVAIAGESAGSMVAALSALRARDAGLSLRAQVLVNPCVDVTSTALDYDSVSQYPETPTLTREGLEFFRRLAVPEGTDPRPLSPLYADHLGGLPPTLVVIPVLDPVADHGRVYADKLRAAGTAVEVGEYTKAGHAFISMPGLVPQAKPARDRIVDFLCARFR